VDFQLGRPASCRSTLFTSLADPLDGEHVQELSNLTGLTSSPSTSNTTTDERGCTVSSLTALSGGMRVRTQTAFELVRQSGKTKESATLPSPNALVPPRRAQEREG
jgi:hypothetical protein